VNAWAGAFIVGVTGLSSMRLFLISVQREAAREKRRARICTSCRALGLFG
jgi:hypothetical protein